MRADLVPQVHDAESLRRYIYGSAEVVGLMCLHVFLLDVPDGLRAERYESLRPGAQALGAAFQKINFLRDLADDSDRLGRAYLVGVDPLNFTEAQKREILADIGADLLLAEAALRQLPRSCRRAVALAFGLFAELTRRLAATPAQDIARTRVRVPGLVKVRLAARTLGPRSGLPAEAAS